MKFIVGPERTSFRIHLNAVTNQSLTLKNLMNSTDELHDSIFWGDVDVDTFMRFVQFIYLGDYYTQEPVKAPPLDHLNLPFLAQSGVTTIRNVSEIHNAATKESLGYVSSIPFAQLSYQLHGRSTFEDLYNACKPRANMPTEDFTLVFLAHARLYVLGRKYGMKGLMRFVLAKLHQTLVLYKLSSNIKPIVELIRYTYSTYTPIPASRKDEFRHLVAAYVSSEIKILGPDPQFLILLAEGGTFVKDVWPLIMDHLRD